METADNTRCLDGMHDADLQRQSLTAKVFRDAWHYARIEGLITVPRDETWATAINASQLFRSTSTARLEEQLNDDKLIPLELPPSAPTSSDVLTISSASLKIIRDVSHIPSQDEAALWAKEACSQPSSKLSRLEVPILRSDPDADCRELVRTIRSLRAPALADHRLPLEPIDTELDEGLDFPASAQQYGEQLIKDIQTETIDVSREAMLTLVSNLKTNWTEEEQLQLLIEDLPPRRHSATERLTPPISPKMIPQEYWVPSHDACQIPIPSDPSSRLSADLKAAEDVLFEKHNEGWTASTPDLTTVSPCGENEMIIQRPVRLKDMKLESPLIAGDHTFSPQPPINMEDVARDLNVREMDNIMNRELPTDKDFKIMLEVVEERITRSIEQERPTALDATLRLPIPVMDFSIPDPGWFPLRNNAQRAFKWIQEDSPTAFNLPKWPRNRRMEDKMTWIPVSSTAGKISMAEPFGNEARQVLHNVLETTVHDKVCTSEDFVWKKPGLAVLQVDDEGDEDEIQPLTSKTTFATDLMRLVMKRKALLGSEARSFGGVGGETTQPSTADDTAFNKQPELLDKHAQEVGSVLLDNERGNAGNLLDNYMELHAPKKRKFTHSRFFTDPNKKPTFLINRGMNDAEATGESAKSPAKPRPAVPVPSIQCPSEPVKILISHSLPRGFVRQLSQLIPGLQLLERDLSAHNTSIWLPGSICRSEIASPLADEADISISPVTGLVLTSMIKVRQKPIPGNGGKSILRTRIEKMGSRYEMLIVLVSEGSTEDTTGDISPSDAMAFAEFQGFVRSLDTSTAVHYVGGGQGSLAKWAAALICRHTHEAADVSHSLVDTETCWELFLRRAGINAFAAQVIAGMLQGPDSSAGTAATGHFGLPAFIKMSMEERIKRFAPVLGGTRVLQRAGVLIDASWA